MQYLNLARTSWHITFGTYGTRLHGDLRPTVDKQHNQRGTPFLPPDSARQLQARQRKKFSARRLTQLQRLFIEQKMPAICDRGGWEYRISAAGVDHVHLLCDVVPEIHGKKVRRLVKRWLGESLSERWPLESGERWGAVGGSNLVVGDESYLNNVYRYILNQRASPLEVCEQ